MKSARSLRLVQVFLLKLQKSSLKRSSLWLIGTGLALALATTQLPKLRLLLSIEDLMDSDFKTSAGLTQLNSEFNEKNTLYLVLAPKAATQTLTNAELCSVQKWIYDEVDGKESYRKILSIFGVKKPIATAGRLHVKPLLDLHCEKDSPSDAQTLATQLKEIHQSPWGRILTSENSRDIAISFYLNDTAKDLRLGPFDVAVVQNTLNTFKKSVLDHYPDLEAHWAGTSLHQYYLKIGMDQTSLLNLGMPILVFILFWFFFASLRTGFLFVATIVLTSLFVYGAMAAFNCPIDVLANTLTLMLVLSSLEDFLFIVHENQKHPDHHWRTALRKLMLPGFFTSLTTAIGFASLVTSNLGIIRRFGLFAALASMLEWFVVFIVLPAFLQKFPKFRHWLTPPKNRRQKIQTTLGKIATLRLPRLICFAALGVYAIALYGAPRLKVSDSPAVFFPKNHVATRDLDYFSKSRGWESQVSLIFKDFNHDDFNRKVSEEISKLPNIATTENPYVIEDYLQEGLAPLDASLVKDLWRDSPESKRLIAKNGGLARSILYIKKTTTVAIDELDAVVTRLCPEGECYLAGTIVSYTEFGDRVLSTLLDSLGVSLILVSFILIYLLWATRKGNYFVTLISALWGPACLICIFWFFDFPITYVTSTFASILVGLTGDNTIQYLFGSRKSKSIQSGVDAQATASIQVTLMMMALSCVLLGSYFAVIRTLGVLFVMGFAATLMGDLFVYQGLLFRTFKISRKTD
jgi:predicted RND superfamily exporter protein